MRLNIVNPYDDMDWQYSNTSPQICQHKFTALSPEWRWGCCSHVMFDFSQIALVLLKDLHPHPFMLKHQTLGCKTDFYLLQMLFWLFCPCLQKTITLHRGERKKPSVNTFPHFVEWWIPVSNGSDLFDYYCYLCFLLWELFWQTWTNKTFFSTSLLWKCTLYVFFLKWHSSQSLNLVLALCMCVRGQTWVSGMILFIWFI